MKKTIQKTYVIDAADQILGRLSTRVTDLLRGKGKTDFVPNADVGDIVVVINSGKVRLSGNKENQKIYYHHTRYPGGIRQITFKDLMIKDSNQVIKKAVYSMLPKNKLRAIFIKKLKILKDDSYVMQEGDIKL